MQVQLDSHLRVPVALVGGGDDMVDLNSRPSFWFLQRSERKFMPVFIVPQERVKISMVSQMLHPDNKVLCHKNASKYILNDFWGISAAHMGNAYRVHVQQLYCTGFIVIQISSPRLEQRAARGVRTVAH